ncbi:hypothetical protein A2121_00815 [Candidatus Nomurabacteria bacterium GWB1_40_6]|uniref:Uncharacterized protein n=1 Tax=Candidatus Nomurabacteria bacterium GWB1_40_6 TaxID=1801727 RepID=A0A1F6TLG6_9BACT|nr:MAG: hypothetical protein A2121_00815 [Candidatus Nomurabacteria bacterium GWB1_40_6]
MKNVGSQVLEMLPQNSKSTTGMKGMILGIINFLLSFIVVFSMIFGGSLGDSIYSIYLSLEKSLRPIFGMNDFGWIFASIPIILAILSVRYGIRGLREKPISKFSITSIVLGAIALIPIVIIGLLALLFSGGMGIL